MEATNEKIADLQEQAERLLASIDMITDKSDELKVSTQNLNNIRDEMVKFIGEVKNATVASKQILTGMSELNTATLVSKLEAAKEDITAVQKSVDNAGITLSAMEKDISTTTLSISKLDARIEAYNTSQANSAKENSEAVIESVKSVGEHIKQQEQETRQLYRSFNQEMLVSMKTLEGKAIARYTLLKFSIWGGALLIVALLVLSIFYPSFQTGI